MSIGVALPAIAVDEGGVENLVEAVIDQARQAAACGLYAVWFGQRFDYDAIGLAAVVGQQVPEVTVGSSVVPITGRHPLLIAAQARTAQAATHGRFALGLGLGSRHFLAPLLGVGEDRPITHLREFLTALRSVMDTGEADVAGETVTARTPWPSPFPGAHPPPPVLIAAMGPQALRVTGELADGTLPFLAGPKALAEHIVPTITEAAARAGRPSPRIIAFAAGVVTSVVEELRATAYEQLSFFESIPPYRAILDREGAARAGDLAVIGSEEQVAARIQRYFDAGATEMVFTQTGLGSTEDRLRTWRLLGELAAQRQ